MPRSCLFVSALGAAAAATIVILSLPAFLADRDRPPPQVTPQPGVLAVAKDLRVIPSVPNVRRGVIATGLAHMLGSLYEEAFRVRTSPSIEPLPTAELSNVRRSAAEPFLTPAARKALAADPDVFRSVDDVDVTSGRVNFKGLVTLDGSEPAEAYLTIDFVATGEGPDNGPDVRLHQQGTLLLVRTDKEWLVDGFDLRFTARELPSPSPGAA